MGCNEKKENIKITYNDENLKYKYIDNKNIEVYIKLEDAFEINDIFNIKIYCDGSIQKITCWYINEETLEINRNTENKDTLNKFEIDSKDDKYIEDRITLIRSMNITYEEYIKELENKNIVLNDSKEVTEEDLNDEGIISYIIPSVEDLELYHKNQMVNKIKNTYLQRYLNRYVKNNLISQSKTEVDENEKNIGNNRLRKPTTNEKRFKRFVNSRVNEMIKTSSFENIEIEKYLSSILVFYEIFDKYTLRDKVDGLFDNKYVIEIKKKMFFNLLSFKLDKIDEEIKNAIIILGIETIIKNKYINDGTIENYKLDAQNKEILLKINEKFDIRENVDNYTKLVIKGLAEEMKTNLNYSVEEKYINDQFGFKTNEQILNLISKKYGSDTKINYMNNILEIIAETKKINDYQHLNQNLIYEIIMYYKNYNKILNKIIVKIENLKDDYSPNIDPIKYIFFEIYINGKSCYQLGTEKLFQNMGLPQKFLDEVAQTMDGYDSLIDFMKNDGKGMEKITFYGIYDEKYENVKKKLEEYGLDVCSSLPGTVEATSKTANKGSALLGICENIGIGADEVMSFGDAENDCPMLDFAKYSFAMENGSDECKAHAEFVTKSNAEDGVAVAVEKYAL